MNDVIRGVLIALIPSLIVAILTAKLTVNLSIRQFRTQKWWENKYETYYKVITCLSRLIYCYREWMKVYTPDTLREFNEEYKNKITEKYNLAIEEFHEIANASVFNISEKAAKEIRKLRDEIEDAAGSHNWYEDACEKHELIENCIRDIRIYSKEDLNIDWN